VFYYFFFIYYSGSSDEEVIGGVHKQDGLYYLQCGGQSKVGASALAYDESAIQWHLRLGHKSLKFIKSLFFCQGYL